MTKTETPHSALPAPAVPARRWHGVLEGMQQGLLYGWAMDSTRPDVRVVLEVCLDDIVLGCCIADVARSDLACDFTALHPSGIADVCHGFVADLGHFSESGSGVLSVRVANTEVQLAGSFARNAPVTPPTAARNQVFNDGGLRLHGWALDPADSRRAMVIRAFVGHEQVAETIANLAHPSMRAYDNGNHGFDLALPVTLADGRVHTVRVVDQNGNALNGSPLTVCCHEHGIKTLLPAQTDSLLHQLIDVYERYIPRSMSMASYADWAVRFETNVPASAPDGGNAAVQRLALLISGADADAIARSRHSIEQLQATNAAIKVYAGPSFATLLRQALDEDCDAIGCVRAGDTLAPHSASCVLEGLALPQAQLVYTDSEYQGKPWFKPAWSKDYALASDAPLELLVVRSSVLAADPADTAALPASAAAFAWQALATLARQTPQAIIHLPRVLYRFHSAPDAAEKALRNAAAGLALQALEPESVLTMLEAPAGAVWQARRLQRPLTAAERDIAVSLVIPTRDRIELLERAISTLQEHTQWRRLQIIVIDNGSTEQKSKNYFSEIAEQGITVLSMPGPFNFADLNNRAIAAASGEIIGMINNDIEALHDGWLDEIIGQLLRPGVGAVGAKLLWPNGMVQHGGVLLGVGNVAGHFGNRLADDDWGDHGRNQLLQQVSGVTAACLFMRKADFFAIGGMDPHAFPVAFNDVDLCLKIRRAGQAIVWTPHARLLHAESASRGHEDTPQKRARSLREIDQLRQRWGAALLRDPAYHPSLNLDPNSHAFGGLAMPPRPRHPRRGELFDMIPDHAEATLQTGGKPA